MAALLLNVCTYEILYFHRPDNDYNLSLFPPKTWKGGRFGGNMPSQTPYARSSCTFLPYLPTFIALKVNKNNKMTGLLIGVYISKH